MKYKLMIFDLDGTILATLDDLRNSVNYALRTLGYPTRSHEEVRAFVGNGMLNLITRSAPNGATDDEIQNILKVFKAHYAEHKSDCTKPYTGIEKVLENLKKDGAILTVLSNKDDDAVGVLCEQYFPNIFDYTAGNRHDRKKKPNPESVHAIINRYGLSLSDTVYIGDSEVDVLTAQNAKVDCVAVSWGFRDRDVLVGVGATMIADNMDKLYEYLTK